MRSTFPLAHKQSTYVGRHIGRQKFAGVTIHDLRIFTRLRYQHRWVVVNHSILCILSLSRRNSLPSRKLGHYDVCVKLDTWKHANKHTGNERTYEQTLVVVTDDSLIRRTEKTIVTFESVSIFLSLFSTLSPLTTAHQNKSTQSNHTTTITTTKNKPKNSFIFWFCFHSITIRWMSSANKDWTWFKWHRR